MRTETICIYKFNELSETAQRRAWENGPGFSDVYADEYRATLAAFEKVFDIRVYHYEVGNCIYAPNFRFETSGAATEAPENRPIRLATYIWNNYAAAIQRGKYYGKLIHDGNTCRHVKRYSRATFEMDNCPLTGVCMDIDVLTPILDCLRYKRFYNSIDDLFNECLTAFFRAWDAEIEWNNSFEYFADWAENNDIEFLETGEMY